jgi:serine/threonine protein kinase
LRSDDNLILGELGLERDPIIMNEKCLEAGIGTLNYMAPEIIKNYINYTKKIDIWSFGCVLYEMIKLERLIDGRKAQIISNLINFKDFEVNFEEISALFKNVLKKYVLVFFDYILIEIKFFKRTLVTNSERRSSTNDILDLLTVRF